MPKKRMLETADERSERLRKKALIAIEEATTAEDALDRMVKRSIRLYGPEAEHQAVWAVSAAALATCAGEARPQAAAKSEPRWWL